MNVSALLIFALAPAAPADDHFEARVRPLFVRKCIKCHSGNKAKSKLRLDSRQGFQQGGRRGKLVDRAKPANSLLLRALQGKGVPRMPPGKPLSKREIRDVAQWLKQGARWPARTKTTPTKTGKHWAFEPVKPQLPPADPSGWSENSIDRFIVARRNKLKLKPNRLAARNVLIRRLSFDLRGLPPTPGEVTAFVNDRRVDAWSRLVDKFLASPRYGERWGRYWLDVARYADTAGDNGDYPIPQMYLYRDYVIDAFNRDMPYDQFVTEQLAGDILVRQSRGHRRRERIVATGFIAISRRFGTAPFQYRHLEIEDTIDATSRSLLALTIRCARCHDHKFDPITNRDYYALYGFFASTQYSFGGAEAHPRQTHMVSLKYSMAEFRRLRDAADKQVNAARKLRNKTPKDPKAIERYNKVHAYRLRFNEDLAYAVEEAKPTDEKVHLQGDPKNRGETVLRNTPAFISRSKIQIPKGSSGRLQLAQWITSRDNPLTARVIVNRVWQHHFGQPLVATPSNFGTAGAKPSHPRLLDWLATHLVRNGWSLKDLHRQIVLSKTYRLSSELNESNQRRDTANVYLWRHSRRQLDAEAIRDAMLFVSGQLDLARPGAHPFPPMNRWNYSQHRPFQAVYPSKHRSVFLMTQRIQRHPYLAIFDGPDTNQTTGSRSQSIVPQQALYLMNNPFVRTAANQLARRLLRSKGKASQRRKHGKLAPGSARRIRLGYRLAWGRDPSDSEVRRFATYLNRYRDQLKSEGVVGGQVELAAWSSLARILLSSNEFLYVD